MQSLGEAIREMDRRPSMHPYARHQTKAGPIRHEVLARGQGRVWLGMRRYGHVEIQLFDINAVMDRISASRPRRWWRFDPDYRRTVSALTKYARRRYERDIINAVTTAYRC